MFTCMYVELKSYLENLYNGSNIFLCEREEILVPNSLYYEATVIE